MFIIRFADYTSIRLLRCLKKDVTIATLNDQLLKLTDHLIYVGSNILSTDSDVNIRILKAWTITGWWPNENIIFLMK